MPVIPQYNASVSPAKRRGPVLEQGQSPRLDASGVVGALNGIAQRVAGMPSDTPNVSPEMGQAKFQGMQRIGQGLNDLGGVIQQIQAKKQEAQDYADVHQAQVAMDVTRGEFEKWKIQNPDPQGWEQEWGERAGELAGSYYEGRNLSEEAKRDIGLRMGAFTQRQAVNVGVEAVKATTQKAREAMFADYRRAIETGDQDTAFAVAQGAFERDWIGPDDYARMQINARDEIRTKNLRELDAEKKTAILNRDSEGALNAVRQMDLPEKEKKFAMTSVRRESGYSILVDEAKDLIAINPRKAAKEIQDEKGKFKDLWASDRAGLFDASQRELNQERAETITSFRDAISLGNRVADLEKSDAFKNLPAIDQKAVRDFERDGALNQISDFMSLKRRVLEYNPKEDPRGVERAEFTREIALKMDGERAAELGQLMEERTNPDVGEVPMSTRVINATFSELEARAKNEDFGAYRLTGKQINEYKREDGTKYFGTPDPNGTLKPRPGFLQKQETVREVKLSGADRLKWKEAKETGRDDFYEDLNAKDSVFSKLQNARQELERMIETGSVTTPDEINDAMRKLIREPMQESFDSRLRSGSKKSEPSQTLTDFLNGTGR